MTVAGATCLQVVLALVASRCAFPSAASCDSAVENLAPLCSRHTCLQVVLAKVVSPLPVSVPHFDKEGGQCIAMRPRGSRFIRQQPQNKNTHSVCMREGPFKIRTSAVREPQSGVTNMAEFLLPPSGPVVWGGPREWDSTYLFVRFVVLA